MPNLYGVAQPNPPPAAGQTIGSADVNCTAGVETNIFSYQPPVPTAPGVYYPAIWGWFTASFGASPPTYLAMALRVNGGADLIAIAVLQAQLVANTNLIIPFWFAGTTLILSYPFSGMNVQLSANPSAQAFTARNQGSLAYAQFVRAPDQ